MKNFFLFSNRCIGMIFILSIESNAQWVQTNGPYGGTILSLAVMDSLILAGTQNCGAYCSTDYGDNWNPINGIPNNADIMSFAVYGHTIMAVTEVPDLLESGIFISTDGGKNWNRSPSQTFFPLVFADSILLGGTNMQGVYRSTDFGKSWNAANSGLGHLDVRAFAVAQQTDSVGGNRIYAGTDSGLFVSTNTGATWTEVDSGIVGKYIVAVAATGMNVIVSTYNSGIFFSTDGGINWSAANTQVPLCDCFSVSDTSIFAGTESGLFRSTDKGNSWMSINNGLATLYLSIHAIAVVPQNMSGAPYKLFAGVYYKGVFRSSNNGENWEPVYHGILAQSIEFVGTSPKGYGGTNLFADCIDGAGGLFISTDKGVSWREDTTEGLSQYEITSLLNSDSNAFASTWGTGIFRSKDYGMTWSPIDSGLDNPVKENVFTSLAVLGTDIYASGGVWVFRSTNGGDNWTCGGGPVLYKGGISYQSEVNSLAVLDSDIFAGTFNTGIFRSTDKGVTWTAVDNGFTGTYVMTLAASGTTIFAATGDSGIFRSTDHGANWTSMSGGLTSLNVWSLVICGKNIFAGTIGSGVLVSTIGGSAWTPVNTGLTPTDIFSLAISSTDLYCATRFGGVWRRPLSEITGVKTQGNESPRQFSLRQNYPNPFNPSTVISYELPIGVFVSLRVYDILGREVKSLVKERQAPGIHSVTFNASSLSSGIYFYKLDAGVYHDTKKLLLLK